MKEIGLDSVVQACQRQVSAKLDGETVVLSLDEGMYYSLNEVGARVWSLIQDAVRVVEIKEALLAEYEVAPERCEGDLLEVLVRLAQLKLVEIRDADGS